MCELKQCLSSRPNENPQSPLRSFRPLSLGPREARGSHFLEVLSQPWKAPETRTSHPIRRLCWADPLGFQLPPAASRASADANPALLGGPLAFTKRQMHTPASEVLSRAQIFFLAYMPLHVQNSERQLRENVWSAPQSLKLRVKQGLPRSCAERSCHVPTKRRPR